MIEQILKSLVLANRRLIIPTIGAFLTKEIDDNQKKVTFSSFLKYDDELLTKLLCEEKNISEAEAKHEIASFAQKISNTLDTGNNYHVIDFGYFTKDSNGIIDFTVENLAMATTFELPRIEEPVIPPYIPPIIETPVFNQPAANGDRNFDFDFSTINIPTTDRPTNSMNVYTQKKSKAGYWIIAIIIAILAILLLLYLFSKDFKNSVNSLFGKQTVETVKTDTIKTPIAVTDTLQKPISDTVAEKNNTTEQEQPVQQASSSVADGKYQVILGSYLERSIAEDFANELKNKGYNVRIPDRLAGEWTIVIAYESNDYADAEKMKEKFIAEGYDDAYVRTRPGKINTSTASSPATSQQSASSSGANANFSTTVTKRGKYQVVAGCYLERSNAENFANELSSKGFDVTVPERLYGEWVLVIVSESDDKTEIDKVRDQCVAAGYNAWIRRR